MERAKKRKEKVPNFLNKNLKNLNASFRKNFSHNKEGQDTYEPIFRVVRDTFSKIPFLDSTVEVIRWENKMKINLALRNNCTAEIEIVVPCKNEEMTYTFYRDHILVSKRTNKSDKVLWSINELMGYNKLIS